MCVCFTVDEYSKFLIVNLSTTVFVSLSINGNNSVCVCPCVCLVAVPSGFDDTAWNNTVLCLPLSYFSSSALSASKFHWRAHGVVGGPALLSAPHPAIIGNSASLFHFLPH